MRLGLVTEQLLAPVPGGTGRYCRELAMALAATARPDDQLQGFVSWHADLAPARIAGVAGPSRLPATPRVLARAWQRGLPPRVRGVDLVHAPTPLAPVTRKPLVVTVHDAVPWTHPQTLTEHGARWHRDIITRLVARGAHLVTPTQAVADELATVLPELSSSRIRVLGGGVSQSLLIEDPEAESLAVLHRLGVPDSYLLTVATLEPRKGLASAIAALAQLTSSTVALVVVGQPGWGGLDPVALAVSAGLSPDRLILLGRRPDAELRVLLRRARALLMPSLAEGFGLPVAEAMALGTAVICSDVPALCEVAGGAAVLVRPGDAAELAAALEAVLGDDELVASMTARGHRQAARHSWTAVAQRAWTLYRSLL